MNPTALLADVADLAHVGVDTGRFGRIAEGGFVKRRRAARNNHPVEIFFLYRVDDPVLARIGTHVYIIFRVSHTRVIRQFFGHFFYIDRSGNVDAAVANKNSGSFHFLPCLSSFKISSP